MNHKQATVKIPLTQGKIAIIDAQDYARVCAHSWWAFQRSPSLWYAQARISGIIRYLHRFLLEEPMGTVDHRDGDGLNCQRNNLRLATKKQNSANRRKEPGTSSVYKGVSFERERKIWKAYIGGPLKHLGRFEFQTEAALAYDRAAIERYGEFARLNFPRGKAAIGKPTFLFVGHGRSGKDTCAEIFGKITGLRYCGSFSWHAIPFMADFLRVHPMVAWERRHENRLAWKDRLDYLRRGDETLLAEMALATGEISAGLRDKAELNAVKKAGLFTRIFWVDRPGTPVDPTTTFGPEDCDEVVLNNGTLDQLRSKLFFWAEKHGLIPGLYLSGKCPTADRHRE
jgi:hypothetical protein